MRVSFLLLLLPWYAAAADAPAKPPLGMNLAGVADWSSELVFVDSFRAARAWISQADGKPWGKGGPLDLDAGGRVKSLAPGQFAETVVWTDHGTRYPEGRYVALYDGDGDLDFTGDAKVVARKPGRLEVDVKARSGAVYARITRTDPKNPLRRVRFLQPGTEKTHEKQPFRDDFLARWKGVKVFRFMDWQATNNNKVVKWDDRAKPDDHSQALKGVCPELMIALCNALDVEPWFCMPHLADEDFVEKFAALVKASLKPTLKVYVEYSNECWNGGFAQARYCADRGKALGLSMNAYEGQLRFYARRSCEVFARWEKAFGGRDRLVRVLATQSANAWTGTAVLGFENAAKKADAVAIAPYFGHRWGDPKNAEKAVSMPIGDFMKELEADVTASGKQVAAYAALAKKHGVALLAYESGQHLAGHGGSENDDKLTARLHEANRHPKMRRLYAADLDNWRTNGGGLNCIFSSMGRYSKWGSWGLLEHHKQDAKSAPKYLAFRDYLEK